MKVKTIDRRRSAKPAVVRTRDIPDGFFLDKEGALWFKDRVGAVLIDARGAEDKQERVCISIGTWTAPQPVSGTIHIERDKR
jgi:hypothetical protein